MDEYIGYINGTSNNIVGVHMAGEEGSELINFKGGEKI
ncbi:hypothetical protein CLROS_018050 [Clostridium felsineum]|uniref:Uncharacterized protein n=1 Tax=Clostridium felsineum TaxID=36839 RepID=A0A1S8KZS5_9CLOT|nr:hypothetical protein CLROS_018050 [Clostridium felsineum]URZ11507.1 hypothetical protein CROST_022240 [Clostridium felsineum]